MGSAPLAGQVFGLVKETLGEGVDPAVEAAIRKSAAHIESLGGIVEEVSLPIFAAGLPAYYVLATAEASSNLARYDGVRYGLRVGEEEGAKNLRDMYGKTRERGLGSEVKRRILMGTYALSAGYVDAVYNKALRVQAEVRREMNETLKGRAGLLMPAAPTVAYGLGEKTSDPLSMYLGDLMTVNLNLSGLPAVTVRCGFAKGDGSGDPLPVGLQIVGKAWGEATLVAAAHVFEATAVFANVENMACCEDE